VEPKKVKNQNLLLQFLDNFGRDLKVRKKKKLGLLLVDMQKLKGISMLSEEEK
jgi:hypothetical protein